MIEVRFYGLLRLDSGIKCLKIDAASVKELCERLEAEQPAFSRKKLKKSILLVNGKKVGINTRLNDGDTVQFLSPSAGG